MTTILFGQAHHPVDLEKYKIDLGPEFGKNFYWDYLNNLCEKERAELFGYACKNSCQSVNLHKQNGQYIASRFLNICKGLCINPGKILSVHQFKMFQIDRRKTKGKYWTEVSEELKEAVLNTICDCYDNQS